MSHDSQNGVGHDVWRCTIFAGFLCKFEVVAAELVSSANSKSSMLPLVIDTWPCTNATGKAVQFAKEMGFRVEIESFHQWRCADVERLESQALPARLQKVTFLGQGLSVTTAAEVAMAPIAKAFPTFSGALIVADALGNMVLHARV